MKAGWCGGCAAYVWLDGRGGCPNGHGPEYVTNVYEAEAPVAPPQAVPAEVAPAPVPAGPVQPAAQPEAATPAYGSKDAVISAVWHAAAAYPQLTVSRSPKADVEIAANLADASWGVGKRKVDFSAVMRADENERTVYYWEMLTEKGAGTTPGFGFRSESYSTFGTKRSGKTKEVTIVPGAGKVADYEWDYSATRQIVEVAVRSQGWAFKVVLRKGKATY